MKKKVMLALAIVMVLGSVKAMAEEISDFDIEHGLGKIDATIDSQRVHAALKSNDSIIEMQIKELEKMQNELADEENTRGLMGALGQTITNAEIIRKEAIEKYDLEKSNQLVIELSNSLSDFKAQDPRNIIPGLHVHEELRFK